MLIYDDIQLQEAEQIMREIINNAQEDISGKIKALPYTKSLITNLIEANRLSVSLNLISNPLPAFCNNMLVNLAVSNHFYLTEGIRKLLKADPDKNAEKDIFNQSTQDWADAVAKFFKESKSKWNELYDFKVGYTWKDRKAYSDTFKNSLIRLGSVFFTTIKFCLTNVDMSKVLDSMGEAWPTGPWRDLSPSEQKNLTKSDVSELLRTSFLFDQIDKINRSESLLYTQEITQYIKKDKDNLETILKASRTYLTGTGPNHFGPEEFQNNAFLVYDRLKEYVKSVFDRNITSYFFHMVSGVEAAFDNMCNLLSNAGHKSYNPEFIKSIIKFLNKRALLVPDNQILPDIGRLKITECNVLENHEEPVFNTYEYVYTPLLDRGSNKVPIASTIPTWNSDELSLESHLIDVVEPLIRSELGCRQRKDLLKAAHWVLSTKDQKFMLQNDCLSMLPQASDISEETLHHHIKRLCSFFDPGNLMYTMDYRRKYESRKWRSQKPSENISLLARRLEKHLRLGYPDSHTTAVNKRQICGYFVEALKNDSLKKWLIEQHVDLISYKGNLNNLVVIATKREEAIRRLGNIMQKDNSQDQKQIRTITIDPDVKNYWEFASMYTEYAQLALENWVPNGKDFIENYQYKIPKNLCDLQELQKQIYQCTKDSFCEEFPNEEIPLAEKQAWKCFHWKTCSIFKNPLIKGEVSHYNDYLEQINESDESDSSDENSDETDTEETSEEDMSNSEDYSDSYDQDSDEEYSNEEDPDQDNEENESSSSYDY